MVTAQLNSYWSKAVGHTEARPGFHATLVRKSAVTKTHNVRPNLENDLANLMCHSRKMEKQTYLLEDKRKNAVATSQQLRNVLRESENDLQDLHSAIQQVFAEEIADGKITVTLVKAKRVQIPAFHGMADM